MAANQIKKTLSEFSICMTNINSLCPNGKKADLKLHTITKQKSDIHIIVDSRIDDSGLKKWRKVQKRLISKFAVFGNFSKDRGVTILAKKNIGVTVSNLELIDPTNTVLFRLTTSVGAETDICAVYAPSDGDSPKFFEKATEAVNKGELPDRLIIGDFNTTMSVEKDQYQYLTDPHFKCREYLTGLEHSGQFLDVYRNMHPDRKSYTWRDRNSNKRGRLDIAMASPSLYQNIKSIEHKAHSWQATDHSTIEIIIDFNKSVGGPGIFRCSPSLHTNPEYQDAIRTAIRNTLYDCLEGYKEIYEVEKMINKVIENLKTEIKELEKDPDKLLDLNNRNIRLALLLSNQPSIEELLTRKMTINEATLHEFILMRLKDITLVFDKSLKKNSRKEAKKLEDELTKLINCDTAESVHQIRTIEEKLAEIEQEFLEKELKFKENFTLLEDEKPSKHFLNLESTKGGYNEINTLREISTIYDPSREEGVDNIKYNVFNSQPLILDKVRGTFQSFYNKQPNLKTSSEELIEFLKSDEDESPFHEFNSRKIPAWMRTKMEGELSAEELRVALFTKMNGSSAPGLDGFTVNWLRTFWPELATITRNALNSCFTNNGLTGLLKTAIVRLLRKGQKDPTLAGNYRPISLLSIHYKLASCCITQRIKPAVNRVVGRQQKAYVEGNVIGSCIINLLNMMKNVNEKKKASLILLIDFRKAFDSIDHNFITTVLKELGFGNDIIKWISLFFDSREAYILLGGNLSKKILLEQGVPQGDVISPYIFIVAVEILLIKITYTKNLTGITFGSVEGRSETFADDTTIYLERTSENLRMAVKYLKDFSEISGLQCNLDKTSVIPIGTEMDITDDNILCPDLDLTWETEFVILGFQIDNKLEKLSVNFKKCNDKVKALIVKWGAYNLSINGRVTIVKSVLLPQYTYIGSVLDKVTESQYNGIQKILDFFVLYNSYLEPNNSAKKNWIKPDVLYAEKHKGGYGQIKVTDFFKAIKTSWVKRYATDRLNDHWCDILDTQFGLTPNTRENIYEWGANKFENVINLNLPCISGFIRSYQEFCKHFATEPNPRENRWLSAPFFNNPKILWGQGRNKKSFTPGQFGLKKDAEKLTLGDLFSNQKPITRDALINKGYNITVLQRNSLEKHLIKLVGHGKQFDATPKKVTVKCDPNKPTPGHLIDNIKDYMSSFKKGSAPIRKIFTSIKPLTLKIDHKKFNGKITGDKASINQITTSLKNLQCKYLSNDYLDYKSRALHGKTQFFSNLAHYKHNVQKWCKHCLEMGIRTSEDFEHAVYTCPQVQYIMHRVKTTLDLKCDIRPSVCIFSCPRPPDATKNEISKLLIIDIIWMIVMKITLKNRSEESRICEIKVMSELKQNLEMIVRNFPSHLISHNIISSNIILKLNLELVQ